VTPYFYDHHSWSSVVRRMVGTWTLTGHFGPDGGRKCLGAFRLEQMNMRGRWGLQDRINITGGCDPRPPTAGDRGGPASVTRLTWHEAFTVT